MVLASQSSTQVKAEFRVMEHDTSAEKGRVSQNPDGKVRNSSWADDWSSKKSLFSGSWVSRVISARLQMFFFEPSQTWDVVFSPRNRQLIDDNTDKTDQDENPPLNTTQPVTDQQQQQ